MTKSSTSKTTKSHPGRDVSWKETAICIVDDSKSPEDRFAERRL
jgi:hypothetical protein